MLYVFKNDSFQLAFLADAFEALNIWNLKPQETNTTFIAKYGTIESFLNIPSRFLQFLGSVKFSGQGSENNLKKKNTGNPHLAINLV